MIVIGLVAKHHDNGWQIDAKTRIMLNKGNLDEYSEKFLHKWLANSLPTSVISILANCLQLNSNQRPKSTSIVLDQLENLPISQPKSKIIIDPQISRSEVITVFQNNFETNTNDKRR